MWGFEKTHSKIGCGGTEVIGLKRTRSFYRNTSPRAGAGRFDLVYWLNRFEMSISSHERFTEAQKLRKNYANKGFVCLKRRSLES